jgi:tetratricopeptide (TPR) repeat protein
MKGWDNSQRGSIPRSNRSEPRINILALRDEQTKQMNALGEEADAVAAHYPAMAEALIWDGIITSERASMASAFSALGLAKRARDILDQAYNIDPAKLDAGAPTSLGVLYYRVPGFPVGFGDKAKARQLLEQAVKLAPNGLDAWYFYGDFLYTQNEYAKAVEAFQHALKIPQHPDRPLWDKNRRLVIEELLGKIQEKKVRHPGESRLRTLGVHLCV